MSQALPNPTSPRGPRQTEDPQKPRRPRFSWTLFAMLAALMVGTYVWQLSSQNAAHPAVDYSQFYDWVENNKVQSVLVKGMTIEGELKTSQEVDGKTTTQFRTLRPDADDELLPLLRKRNVRVRVEEEGQPFAIQVILSLLPWVLIIGLWIWMSRRAQNMMSGGGGLGGILKSKSRKFERNTAVDVTFEDVAGLGSAKRDLQEIVQFLKEPERFRRLGGKVPRGVLLVGPPGTGKTLLARAVAGESGVPFYSISASEFIEMFVGVGAARVRDLFEEAKNNEPAIIFIDEIDAVGRSRGAGLGGGHDEREQTLNQLLSEMDGFNRNDLTIVLAATNRPDVLDPALLRPGRFDRRVFVDRPELDARKAILEVHVKNKPLASDVDLRAIAKKTPGFSGADLANLANEAALHATRRGADVIEASDFSEAYDKIVLGDPREGKLALEEKERVAVHESGHAVVAQFSSQTEALHRVTIIPRGMALGATQQTPLEDRHLMTQPEIESRLRVLLGGYAAERLVFGTISTGAENDLKEATKLATKMVSQYGMSKLFGPVYYEHDVEHPFLGRRIAAESGTSDSTTHAIEEETRKILGEAFDAASELLKARRVQLNRLKEALLDQETLEGEALANIFANNESAEASSEETAPT